MEKERPCANPRCSRTLNAEAVPEKIRYCTHCQIRLAQLKKSFPLAQKAELAELLVNGAISLMGAARLLRLPYPSLYGYYLRGYLLGKREGRKILIYVWDLQDFREKQKKFLLLSEVTRELRITRKRIKYLADTGYLRISRPFGRRAVPCQDLALIFQLDQKLCQTILLRRTLCHWAEPKREEFSSVQAAAILGVSLEAIALRAREGTLLARKRKGRWYIRKVDFGNFCQEVVNGRWPFAKPHLKKAAQNYLACQAVSH